MYSVDLYLRNVYNVQTKWVLLQWLQRHGAAKPSIGLVYRFHAYQSTLIY